MDWITVGKFAAKFVATSSVNQVVKQAIRATMPTDVTKVQRVMLGLGGFIISSWIVSEASDHAVNELDSFLNKKETDEHIKSEGLSVELEDGTEKQENKAG